MYFSSVQKCTKKKKKEKFNGKNNLKFWSPNKGTSLYETTCGNHPLRSELKMCFCIL